MSKKAEAARRGQAGAEEAGRYPVGAATRAEAGSAARAWTNAEPMALMEAVLARGNLMRAYQRVVRNKGAPGVDGVTVAGLKDYLTQHWPTLKARLLTGEYWPQPVRPVAIPKPNGGTRTLGIPTAVDRLIQQALHQVLSPIFKPTFSLSSYGFRPGRGAQDAVQAARAHVAAGRRWVVDIDLEKFFDRVNHDVLMARVARRIGDCRVLGLIRRYLEAGVMADGPVSPRREGTPQGGPLSPLLSNILLTDLDRELERRGHAFVRYADDCNVYVRSQQAGERVLAGLSRFLQVRLKLQVNPAKSACARPWRRKFLGYSVSGSPAPAAAGGALEREATAAKAEGDSAPGAGPLTSALDCRAQPRAAGLGGVLPLGREQGPAGGAGRMAAAQAAVRGLAAVETRPHPCPQSDAAGP